MLGSGGYPMEIVQREEQINIVYEAHNEARRVYFGARNAPQEDRVPGRNGYSSGHWEGDTLVVETTNFDDRIVMNSFNCCGLAGEHLRITERFRRVSAKLIEHQYTVDDPAIYTRPWTVSVPLQAIDGPVYEYACHEGNLAMIGILNGARAKEKQAAK